MKAKDWLFVGISFVCSLILIAVLWTLATKDVETKIVEKKVPVKVEYNIEGIRKWMLRVGVSDAWVSYDQIRDTKADCFSTVVLISRYVLSYCELRR